MTASSVTKGFSPGPDEWQHLEDLSQRRRVQNRLSQRNRRTNLRNQLSQNQNQSRETTATNKTSSPSKQTRQFFWVPPNTSTARGKPLTAKSNNHNKAEPSRPPDPEPVVAPDGNWLEIWDSALHEKPPGEEGLRRELGGAMDSSWMDNLMRSPGILPMEEDALGCNTPPMAVFNPTITFDARPVPTTMPGRDGDRGPAQGNSPHRQGPPVMKGAESGHTDGCKAPAPALPATHMQIHMQQQSTVQPHPPEINTHLEMDWDRNRDRDMDRARDRDIRDHFFGYAALHVAASRGHLPIVQLLTARGMPVDLLSSENETALHVAAEKGHFAVAHYLLERGAQPDRTNQHGETALHVAAGQGHGDIVQLLCSYLPDPNVLDRNGHTALHRAVAEGHVDVVRVMLERGMDAEMKVGLPLDPKGSRSE